MGFFRFRRSIKLFPGVRLNFGKKSASVSLGVRGARYTVGTKGRRATVGIPGTGLSYTTVDSGRRQPGKEYTGEKPRSGCLTYGFLGLLVMMLVSVLIPKTRSDSPRGIPSAKAPDRFPRRINNRGPSPPSFESIPGGSRFFATVFFNKSTGIDRTPKRE